MPFNSVRKGDKRKTYSGDLVHGGGVSQSVEATVKDRHGRTMLAIKEIRSIVEDCRSNTLGGLKVGLDIYGSLSISPVC